MARVSLKVSVPKDLSLTEPREALIRSQGTYGTIDPQQSQPKDQRWTGEFSSASNSSDQTWILVISPQGIRVSFPAIFLYSDPVYLETEQASKFCLGGIVIGMAGAVIGMRGLQGSNEVGLLLEYMQFIAWSSFISDWDQSCLSVLHWSAW